MGEFLNNLIAENFGVATVLIIAVVILIIFVVWKTSKIYFVVKNLKCGDNADKIDELARKSFDRRDLPCDRHREMMGKHDSAVARIERSVEYLTEEIRNAMNVFQKQNIRTDGFTQTQSPLSITPAGWEMVKRLGLDNMFNDNWGRIKELIDKGVEDKNAYDINNFCIEQSVVFPERFLSDADIAVLKNDAYLKGLTLASYMKVVAVMARDKYFAENGIDVDDLDKNGSLTKE